MKPWLCAARNCGGIIKSSDWPIAFAALWPKSAAVAVFQGAVTSHFLSYLDITRRYEAEESLRELTAELEQRVADRTSELEFANRRLEDPVAERDLLMVEVNHRAKNSLAVAASLLHVQARRQTDPAIASLFQEAQDHLGAMSRVHDLLSRSENEQRVDIATYFSDLCEPLTAVAGSDNRIRFINEAPGGILIDADTAFRTDAMAM